MSSGILSKIVSANRVWIKEFNSKNAGLLKSLESVQKPYALVIGCSDSRVPVTLASNAKPVYSIFSINYRVISSQLVILQIVLIHMIKV